MLTIGRAVTWRWLTAIFTVMAFLRCGPDQPPVEAWIRLELNDSLALFDSVHIDLIRPNDTSKVLQILWQGELPNPSGMPEQKLTFAAGEPYHVRVRAWAYGELGWEAVMVPIDTGTLVVRTPLPPLRPYLVDLASLSSNRGEWDPAFQPARTGYRLILGYWMDSLRLRAEPADSRAKMAMRQGTLDLGTDSARFAVPEGSTEVTVVVSNRGDKGIGEKSQTYRITVLRPVVPSPRLRSLKATQGLLVPAFSPEHFEYTLNVGHEVARLTFDSLTVDTFAVAMVGADTLRNGQLPNSINLNVGENALPIEISLLHRSTDYSIKVIRAADTTQEPDPEIFPPVLVRLAVEEGSFDPHFRDFITEYSLELENHIALLHFLALKADSGSVVHVNGETLLDGQLPKPFTLAEGLNTFPVRVTNAATQLETIYTLRITRKPRFRLAGFAHSAKIHLNTTATGANVQGRVTGFPVLIRLRAANFDFSQARFDGRDIRIAKSDSTLLPREIEYWDSANAIGDIWTRVDTIHADSEQQIAYLCWGNPTAPPAGQPAAVFPPADGFAAVWHMDSAFNDATGNANRGTPRQLATANAEGFIGRSFRASGDGKGVDFGNGPTIRQLTTSIQFEGWVRSTQANTVASVIRHNEHFTPLQLISSGGAHVVLYTQAIDSTRIRDSLKIAPYAWSGTYNDDAWHQIVAQYEATSGLAVYWDGKVVVTDTTIRGPLNVSNKPFMIGISENGDQPYMGSVDEVRVYNRIQPAHWIRLNYEVMKPGSKVITLEP
jgi:Concanavalin A-like lectin/glucanases superfamily/Domain of unknown function (DUF2341)/Cadherin-like beta sandwich domain